MMKCTITRSHCIGRKILKTKRRNPYMYANFPGNFTDKLDFFPLSPPPSPLPRPPGSFCLQRPSLDARFVGLLPRDRFHKTFTNITLSAPNTACDILWNSPSLSLWFSCKLVGGILFFILDELLYLIVCFSFL